jgi:hypothetical protein
MNANTRSHSTLTLIALALFASAPASASNFHDFEDGTLGDWLSTVTGGTGSFGVELHNGSKMAFVNHNSAGSHSLSHDYTYSGGDNLSFVMHPVALVGDGTNAYAGVTISFLNAFNVGLGSVGIYNATTPGIAPTGSVLVDNVQHSYSFLESTLSATAGIANPDSIARMSVRFIGVGQSSFFNPQSSGTVWFDNIGVSAVPEGPVSAMLLAGLACVAIAVRGADRRAGRG